jgi:PAS domain S-box-containing protein
MLDSVHRRASARDPTRPERLRRWVVALGVAAIVANLGIDAFNQWRSYRFAIDDANRELLNDARILAAQTEGTLKTVDVLLREAAESYANDAAAASPGAVDAVLAGRVQGLPQLLSLTIANAQGVQLYRSRSSNDDSSPSIRDRSYFIAQRDNPTLGLFVSEPVLTRTQQRFAIVLSRRLNDGEGRFAGIVSGAIDLDKFQQFYHQIRLGTRSAILLFRNDGTLLVREPPMPDRIGKTFPTIAAELPALDATRVVTSVDGVPRFVARAQPDGFPLTVAVAREEAAVLEPWRKELFLVAGQDVMLSALIAVAIAALVHQLRRVEAGERALRESEERYALAMEGANEGHFDRNLQEPCGYMSPKMKDLLGIDPAVTPSTRDEALTNVHPDDRPGIDAAFERHLQGRTERYEVEYRVRQADGEWHWILARARCLRDSAGEPCRHVGSAIDVSERKRAEAEKDGLEIRLRKSQKMEAIGTLAGGIAHDFNNILGAILGYSELAQKHAAAGSVVRRYMDNVMHAGGRAKGLVEQILAFSRSGLGERGPVNVQAVTAETLDLLAASLPARIRLDRQLATDDAAVMGDATQLHQVVMNLCTNAMQAMPSGGVLAVSLERVEVRERRALLQGELIPGSYVRLGVSDTGKGIEDSVLDRMFDPFFTTKGVGAGTGLGLSLVHGIVADVGGAIDVATFVGDGTAFKIWLPVVGTVPAPATEVHSELPLGNGEVIMVVDDEPLLVTLAEEMLAELGYEPVGFESGSAALNAFVDDPNRFDAVLTDEMMPGLTGSRMATDLHRIRPDVPIVIMSGYVDTGVAVLARAAGVADVLHKPLQSRDIAETLARALAIAAPSPAAVH